MTPKEQALEFVYFAFRLDQAFDMQFPICDRKNLFTYIKENMEEAIDIALEEKKNLERKDDN